MTTREAHSIAFALGGGRASPPDDPPSPAARRLTPAPLVAPEMPRPAPAVLGRHGSHKDMEKVWNRERRKQQHAADKLINVSFAGHKFRQDGRAVSMNNVAAQPAADMLHRFDDDGGGTLSQEELMAMGRGAMRVMASDADGDGDISVAELQAYTDQTAALAARQRRIGRGGSQAVRRH